MPTAHEIKQAQMMIATCETASMEPSGVLFTLHKTFHHNFAYIDGKYYMREIAKMRKKRNGANVVTNWHNTILT